MAAPGSGRPVAACSCWQPLVQHFELSGHGIDGLHEAVAVGLDFLHARAQRGVFAAQRRKMREQFVDPAFEWLKHVRGRIHASEFV